MIKHIYSVIIVFSFSSFMFLQCEKEQKVSVLTKLNHKEKELCNPLNSVILEVLIRNNTKDSIYIEDVSPEIIMNYIPPIHENYGSYKKYIDARLNNVKRYIKDGQQKQGDIKDTLNITLPFMDERYQVINLNDTIDFYEDYYNLNTLYLDAALLCKTNPYEVPTSPKPNVMEGVFKSILENELLKFGIKDAYEQSAHIDTYLGSTLFLKPKEEIKLSYDIGMLFLQKSTYEIKFIANTNEQDLFFKDMKIIGGFKKYKEKIESDIIYVTSK